LKREEIVRTTNAALLAFALAAPFCGAVVTMLLPQAGYRTGMSLFAMVCHQNASRSYVLNGRALPICWRDTWVYAGLFVSSFWTRVGELLYFEVLGRILLLLYFVSLVLKVAGFESLTVSFVAAFFGGVGMGLALPNVQRMIEARILTGWNAEAHERPFRAAEYIARRIPIRSPAVHKEI